jgi:hypothetical protein
MPPGSSTPLPSKPPDLQPSADNRLEFLVAHPGSAWFTLLSLFPPTWHDQPNGFRPDLMDKLAALHPKFLRFPGGNYLEGQHLNEHFDWKQTIGPLVDRPGHQAPWMYRSTDGMGLLEMLTWCEDLHMEPLLAVFSGYALDQTHINPGSESPAVRPGCPRRNRVRHRQHFNQMGRRACPRRPSRPLPPPLPRNRQRGIPRSLRHLRRSLRTVLQSHQTRSPQLQIIAVAPSPPPP